jgi:hypothetical protein
MMSAAHFITLDTPIESKTLVRAASHAQKKI